MKKIKLTLGKFTLVDDEDFDRLNKIKWSLNSKHDGYARSAKYGMMSRYIMDTPKNKQCDHMNHNVLDNRKENLRNCTPSHNHYNTKKSIINKSGYKGVSRHKMSGKWEARIRVMKIKKHIGLFMNKIEAARAYDNYAIRYHKKFAKLNFV